MELVLERRDQENKTGVVGAVLIAPPIDEYYWTYRVRLSESQAIVGFPKFTTIGIGFAMEEDWNTNLPYSEPADNILRHIIHNKGDEGIAQDDVRRAIEMVQEAAREDRDR